MFAGETGAVLVLGRRTLTAVGQGGHLDGYLAPRRRHLLKTTWQANTLHDLATNAVGRGFQKDNRLQAFDILMRADHLQLPAGAAFFAVERQPVHLAGACLAQAVGGISAPTQAMRSSTLIDGKVWNGADPEGYARSFAIQRKGA